MGVGLCQIRCIVCGTTCDVCVTISESGRRTGIVDRVCAVCKNQRYKWWVSCYICGVRSPPRRETNGEFFVCDLCMKL